MLVKALKPTIVFVFIMILNLSVDASSSDSLRDDPHSSSKSSEDSRVCKRGKPRGSHSSSESSENRRPPSPHRVAGTPCRPCRKTAGARRSDRRVCKRGKPRGSLFKSLIYISAFLLLMGTPQQPDYLPSIGARLVPDAHRSYERNPYSEYHGRGAFTLEGASHLSSQKIDESTIECAPDQDKWQDNSWIPEEPGNWSHVDRTDETFDDDVNHIKQGNLNNCWALAALVSHLNLNPLSSILRKHENITAGGKKCTYYSVRLDGEWWPVDTLVPRDYDGKPLFGQGKIAAVFEKAVAKKIKKDATSDHMLGDGYGPLDEGGYAEEALYLLTGDHYIQVHSKDVEGVKLAKMLLYGFQFGMTASWDGHAQSVIDVDTEARTRHEVSDINTFVRIRNQVGGTYTRMSVQEYKRENIRTGIAVRATRNRNYDNDGRWAARYEEYQTHHNGWLKEQAVRRETNKRVRQANVARETHVNYGNKCYKYDNMTGRDFEKKRKKQQNYKSRCAQRGKGRSKRGN